MRVCDLAPEQVKVGLMIIGLVTEQIGTIIKIDLVDNFCWIRWQGDSRIFAGFANNRSFCQLYLTPIIAFGKL